MPKKKKCGDGHGGGHGWFVTFADLMGLLMSFFVMVAAYSTMDQQKMKMVMGSMREAFGTTTETRYAGVIEIDGLPSRHTLKNLSPDPEKSTDRTTPQELDSSLKKGTFTNQDRQFALATVSLRQALQDLPEIAEVSKNLIVNETKDGLEIELVDQEGRSMFPEGSKDPYERTRRALYAIGGRIQKLPYRIRIEGHTSASRLPPRPGYGPWELSADRANSVRSILQEAGVPSTQVSAVAGRADTLPMFPDDPYMMANRRITILLMKEAPVLPPSLQ